MKKILILGVIAFVLALLIKTPASLISTQIESHSLFSLRGVQGSLWKGKAAQVKYEGIEIGKVSWTVKPLHLLTGAAKGVFTVESDELNANGNYAVSFGNTLILDNTEFDVAGSFINKFQKYGLLNGTFRGQIDYLETQMGESSSQPVSLPIAAAMINWEQGGLSNPIQLPEGNYQLKIEPESEDTLIGKINSKDAPVDISGNVTLDKNWKYQSNLKIKTTASGKSLQGMLSMAGQLESDGYIHIKESGKLFK